MLTGWDGLCPSIVQLIEFAAGHLRARSEFRHPLRIVYDSFGSPEIFVLAVSGAVLPLCGREDSIPNSSCKILDYPDHEDMSIGPQLFAKEPLPGQFGLLALAAWARS